MLVQDISTRPPHNLGAPTVDPKHFVLNFTEVLEIGLWAQIRVVFHCSLHS